MSIFGNFGNTNTNVAGNTGSNLFGAQQNNATGGTTSIFGQPSQTPAPLQAQPTLPAFGSSTNTNTNTGGTNLFGNNNANQTQNAGGISGSIFGATNNNANQGAAGTTNNNATSSLFGANNNNNATTGTTGTSLFGNTTGNNTANANTGSTNIFGNTNTNTGTNIFGNPGGTTQQQQGNSLFNANAAGNTNTTGTTNLFGNTGAANTNNTGTGTNIFGNPGIGAPQQAGNSLFGNPSANTAGTNTTNNIFGNPATNTTTTGTSNLFGNTGTNTNTGSNLFGSTNANTNTTSNLFGNTNTNANTGANNLFGASKPAGTGLFGSTTNTTGTNTNTGTNLFGQQQAQQPQQQQQSSLFGSTLFGTKSTFGTSALGGAPAQQNAGSTTGGTQQQSADAVAQYVRLTQSIERIYNAWNPASPNCAFQHNFYNLVDPKQVNLYGRPPNALNDAIWQKTVQENPDPSCLVPVIAIGFDDLRARIDAQSSQSSLQLQKIADLQSRLSALRTQHAISNASRLLRAAATQTQVVQRLMRFIQHLHLLIPSVRSSALRPEEEALRGKLEELEEEMRRGRVKGRLNELWAVIGAISASADRASGAGGGGGGALGGDLSASMLDGGAGGGAPGEWAVVDEEGLAQIAQILAEQQAGLQHLTKILQKGQKDLGVILGKRNLSSSSKDGGEEIPGEMLWGSTSAMGGQY